VIIARLHRILRISQVQPVRRPSTSTALDLNSFRPEGRYTSRNDTRTYIFCRTISALLPHVIDWWPCSLGNFPAHFFAHARTANVIPSTRKYFRLAMPLNFIARLASFVRPGFGLANIRPIPDSFNFASVSFSYQLMLTRSAHRRYPAGTLWAFGHQVVPSHAPRRHGVAEPSQQNLFTLAKPCLLPFSQRNNTCRVAPTASAT
jgi:hypothetical protein